jgi:hypothetical protein
MSEAEILPSKRSARAVIDPDGTVTSRALALKAYLEDVSELLSRNNVCAAQNRISALHSVIVRTFPEAT